MANSYVKEIRKLLIKIRSGARRSPWPPVIYYRSQSLQRPSIKSWASLKIVLSSKRVRPLLLTMVPTLSFLLWGMVYLRFIKIVRDQNHKMKELENFKNQSPGTTLLINGRLAYTRDRTPRQTSNKTSSWPSIQAACNKFKSLSSLLQLDGKIQSRSSGNETMSFLTCQKFLMSLHGSNLNWSRRLTT